MEKKQENEKVLIYLLICQNRKSVGRIRKKESLLTHVTGGEGERGGTEVEVAEEQAALEPEKKKCRELQGNLRKGRRPT